MTGRSAAASRRLSRALTLVLVLALAGLALRLLVVEPLRIRTASMSPTLVAGQHVLADKVSRGDGGWRRGDVVAFRRTPEGELLVKRIVALGGDRVGLADGRLVVNGRTVSEPYADPDRIDSVYFGPVVVPAGHVFVLGDNRAESRDSRAFGAIEKSALVAKVDAIVWPLPPTRKGLK